MIKKINNFYPLGTVWEVYTHCTYWQISPALPQAKISKRVQAPSNKELHLLKINSL